MQNMNIAMDDFFDGVRSIFARAQEKGYSKNIGGDGRDLLDFIKDNFPGHAEGEASYKIIRWAKKRDPIDLLKAGAWIFLIWDQYNRGENAKGHKRTPRRKKIRRR